MRILHHGLLVLAGLIFAYCVLPAAAQVASPYTSGTETASADDVQKASDALIRVLNDPDSRTTLIRLLEQSASGEQAGDTSASEQPSAEDASAGEAASQDGVGDAATDENFAVQIGEYTRSLADDAGVLLEQAKRSLNGLVLIARGEIPIKWSRTKEIFIQVFFVLLAAYAGFVSSQVVAKKIYPRMAVNARYGGGLTRTFMLLLTSLVDAVTVGIGWAIGNGAGLLSYGGFETGVSLSESLALNAFFMVGIANVSLRFIFAPGRPELRLLPFTDESSFYWYRRLRLFMYWMIYGVFLVVPLSNIAVSFVLGNALRFLTVLLGMLFLVILVQRNRARVHEGTRDYAMTLQSSIAQRALSAVGRFWHIAAFGYIAAVFIIWVTRPFDATTIILRATGLSILTIMGGMALSLVMTRAIRGGIRLPEEINSKLPALQHRLNAFVPRLLKIIRFAVFLATVLLLLEIWGLLSSSRWFSSQAGVALMRSYGSAFLVIIVAFAIWLAVMSWVDLRLQSRSGYIVTARERTLFQLFRNASTVVIVVMAVLLSLSEIGVNIGPLIAGAGVVGLAISFGAQTLVKDIITGAFIQIENAMNEGDFVTVAGISGTVEGITVRSVRMRDLEGTSHIIPFSSVDMVSNFMRGFSYHVALIGVSYDTSIPDAKEAMEEAFRRLKASSYGTSIFDDLEMHGVTNFGASSIDIRARIKTTPGDQWAVGRAYNEFIKQVFDERDIEIPFPQVTYHAATPPYAVENVKANKKTNAKTEQVSTQPADDAPPEGGEG